LADPALQNLQLDKTRKILLFKPRLVLHFAYTHLQNKSYD